MRDLEAAQADAEAGEVRDGDAGAAAFAVQDGHYKDIPGGSGR
jgi:hypothetical protein